MSARSSFLNAEWTLNFDCYCNGGYLTLSLPLFNGQFWLDGIVSLSLSLSLFRAPSFYLIFFFLPFQFPLKRANAMQIAQRTHKKGKI
jgi:hypothetical protein